VTRAAWLFLTLVVACTARNPAFRDDELVRPGPDAEAPAPDTAPPLAPDAAMPAPDAPPLAPDAPPLAPDAAPEDAALPADAAPDAPALNPDLPPPAPDLAADRAPPSPDVGPDATPATGLTGFYFKDNRLTTLAFQRVDPIIDFSWGNDPPDPSIPFLGFTVRWTGKVHTLYAETYTFSVHSGDGCRLWIDGHLLIDNWRNQAPTEVFGQPTAFTSGWHEVKLEYLHNTGWSSVLLLWESPTQKRGVVQSEYLLPD